MAVQRDRCFVFWVNVSLVIGYCVMNDADTVLRSFWCGNLLVLGVTRWPIKPTFAWNCCDNIATAGISAFLLEKTIALSSMW